MAETTHRYQRVGPLPAHVEIMLAVGDAEEARHAAGELEEHAEHHQSFVLRGVAAQSHALVDVAQSDPRAALAALRKASEVWQELQTPYARAGAGGTGKCRAMGAEDTAALELEAVWQVFEELGAAPDVARVDSITQAAGRETMA